MPKISNPPQTEDPNLNFILLEMIRELNLSEENYLKLLADVEALEIANAASATSTTNADHILVVDNENANENNLIPFIEDATATGNVGLESDGDFHYNPSTGTVTATTFSGNFSGSISNATTATNANHVSVADNESTDENNLIPFIEDASATGNVGLESDGDFHYNPSTGKLTATQLAGTLQTASQTNITSVGTLTSATVSGATTSGTLRLTSTTDLSLSSTGHAFQVGPSSGANIAMDGNEIMARNNGATSDLYLNNNGGLVRFGGDVTLQGDTYNVVWDKSADALEFADSAKAVFGTGDDMSIHWDGTDGHFTVAGTLNIDGSGETLAKFIDDGAVELYNNGSKKFETTTSGIKVTHAIGGTIQMQTQDTTINQGDRIGMITFSAPDEASGTDAILNAAIIKAEADATFAADNNQTDLVFSLGSSEAATEKMRLHHEGNLSLSGHSLSFEGATADAHETTLTVTDPTADRTITLPDATGTVALTSQLPSTALDDITAGDAAVTLATTTGDITIDAQGNDTDIIFKGTDNSVDTTFLTIDGSAAGSATFNSSIIALNNKSTQYYWMSSDNAVALYSGVNFEISLNHVHNTGFRLNNTGTGTPAVELQFVDSNESIGSNGTNLLLKSGGQSITVPSTAGTVALTSDSSERTLLATTTLSSTLSCDFSSTYITDDYNTYDVVFVNVHASTDNVSLRCRMGHANSAVTDYDYGYYGQMRGTKSNDSYEWVNYYDNSANYMSITANDNDFYLGTATSENFNGHLRFFNLRETDLAKGFEVLSGAYRTSDNYWGSWAFGIGWDKGSFSDKKNYLAFFLSSGNFASGTIKLYGLNR